MSDVTAAAAPSAEALVARAAGLVYVVDGSRGFKRKRVGDGFQFFDANRRRVRDKEQLARIAKLAIPPAYEDVWICVDPRGHLQATGRDARGRKQYRYHPEWRTTRDDEKFERMIAFGAALPKLRRRVRADLDLTGLPRDKVLATLVGLLDATRIRVGNEAYARDNKSFGLTTLRNRHAAFVSDGRLTLRFRGKGGLEHEVTVDDKRLAAIVRRCQQLPGQLLFQYLDDDGERRPVSSDLVNEYLRDAMGDDFTAKDFRTWGATMRAVVLMAVTPLPEPLSERAQKSCIVAAIAQVAKELRNTPAVCRKSYINPVVFTRWRDGTLHAHVGTLRPRNPETATLKFLRANAALEKRAQRGGGGKRQPRAAANVAAMPVSGKRVRAAGTAPLAVAA